MIHPCVIALSDWFRDPDTGPNAFLPTLVLEPEDAGLVLEPIKRVFDPFRDMEAFANTEPGAYPSLLVTPASPVDVAGEVNQNEQDALDALDLLVRIVVAEIVGPKALRQLSYYLVAVNRSVSAFFAETEAARTARQRGHVQIITCQRRSYALSDEDLGAAKVGGQMLLRMTTRDTEAS